MFNLTLLKLAQRAPVQQIQWPSLSQRGIELFLWRLDLLDAVASGNKLFKLAENLQAARREGYARVLSFGGAFSNHIHALACAGREAGLDTIGVIRGEERARENPTLRDAAAAGMQLYFVDRETYRALTRSFIDKAQNNLQNSHAWRDLHARFGRCYVVPEGGANRLGVLGCQALGAAIRTLQERPDIVVLPAATGSTLAGVVSGLNDCCQVVGIAVLKGGSFIADQVREYLREAGSEHCAAWRIELDHHCGGYARTPEPLAQFVARFSDITGVGIEPVYSGKMLYAIHRLGERGEFARGTRILAVHTGGMQGARGFRAFE